MPAENRTEGGRKAHVKIPLEELEKDWRATWERFNPDSKGEVKMSQLRQYLSETEVQHELPLTAVDLILQRADKDMNGKISYAEFLDIIQGHDFDNDERPLIRRAIWVASYIVPKKDREKFTKKYHEHYTCRVPPFFMLTVSLVELGFFIYHTVYIVKERGWPGINGPAPLDSVLIYNPYKRQEAWRFITYMFVHSGFMHITVNILVQLFLGIPLELVHRWWRVLIVYMVGVLAGSLATSITDPRIFLCGASGGVYSLMAAHLASIIINWSEMEFNWLRLIFFTILGISDFGVAIYYRYVKDIETQVGYVAHLAGAIVGLLAGIFFLRNLRPLKWEKVLKWISLAVFIILIIGAIAFNIFPADGHFPAPKK